MSPPARDEIESEYKWDLSQIFETDADWEEVRKELLEDLDALTSELNTPVVTAEKLDTLVESIADLYLRRQRLELYASLTDNITDSEESAARMRRYRELDSEFKSAVASIHQDLREIDLETFNTLVSELGERSRYLHNIRRQARYRQRPVVEEVVGEFEEVRTAPNRIIRAVTEGDFEPPEVERPDGERVEVTKGRYRKELSSPNRDYRHQVYQTYHAELNQFEETLATAYAEKLKALAALSEVRGYDSIRQMQFRKKCYPENGLESEFSTDIHDTMLSAVQDNLEPYHKAQRVRAASLGVSTLRPWDRSVSTAESASPEIPYERAKKHIIEAVAPLGSDYQADVRAFFEANRIDVYPCEGKASFAYCPSSIDDGAFILMNYQESFRSMFTLCHELGHAMHVEHLREEPTVFATGPRAVEEIPSVLHELLLIDHCLNQGGSLAAQARNRLVDSIGGLIYGQTMYSLFKQRLAEIIENGAEPSAERMTSQFTELQEEFLPHVEWPDYARREWLNTALFRDPFHHYQYVLGATGALAVHDHLKSGEITPGAYQEFLRSTGQSDTITQFDNLGMSVTSKTPYRRAAESFDHYLGTFR